MRSSAFEFLTVWALCSSWYAPLFFVEAGLKAAQTKNSEQHLLVKILCPDNVPGAVSLSLCSLLVKRFKILQPGMGRHLKEAPSTDVSQARPRMVIDRLAEVKRATPPADNGAKSLKA